MPCAAATERIGLILAGGRNSAAEWNWRAGVSLLDQAGRILNRAGLQRVIISGAANRSDSLDDLQPDQGPLGGIASVLRSFPELSRQTLVVLPTDMPAINPRALTRLAEIAEFHGQGALFDLGPLPLALVINSELVQAVDETLQDTGSMEALVARLGLPVLASLPDDGLDNVGSVKEVEEVRQRLDAIRAEAAS
ncbi:MAG: NTP transferase domain-containing protein [Wenzhouxiangella sp.]|jgi:molybdopterin-guanine dinucleotide biosynthesis protein A|nr:NTP transferase domain-containing protein [Wenzhouxiangella sp.]